MLMQKVNAEESLRGAMAAGAPITGAHHHGSGDGVPRYCEHRKLRPMAEHHQLADPYDGLTHRIGKEQR